MTFEELVKANATIKTTSIKNKQYAEVNQRIKAFRMIYPDGCIHSDIISLENGICVMKATVTDGDGKIIGTGHAYEKEDSSFINSTSYIENCETSAVGRALGMVGIGIDTSVASAEEVQNAIHQQDMNKVASKAKIVTLQELCKKHNVDSDAWLKKCNRTWDILTEGEATKMLITLRDKFGEE